MEKEKLVKIAENGRFVKTVINDIIEDAKDKKIEIKDNVIVVIPSILKVSDNYVKQLEDSEFPLHYTDEESKVVYSIYNNFSNSKDENELQKIRKSFNVFSCNFTSSIFSVYYKNGGSEWQD